MEPAELEKDFEGLTKAVIDAVRDNSFSHLKSFLSWLCKLRLEQGVRLSDIMTVFDLYENSLKDAMSLYLQEDLVTLNRMRREIDALLDKARVYVSEYFFVLYEETVFKQFEQLRVINEISARLVSSLKLDQVLGFIMTNALRLFKASCGSISLVNSSSDFVTQISHGWLHASSPKLIDQCAYSVPDIIIASARESMIECLQHVIEAEGLCKLILLKLRSKKRVIGLLAIGLSDDRKFTDTDKQVLFTFANHAAIAVHNAQLYADTDQKLQKRIYEATVLLEQNRALLHSIREGVIAIDNRGYITLVNREAQRRLNMTENPVGRHISEVVPNTRLLHVLKTRQAEYDQEHLLGDKAVITNRMPIIANGKVIGAIATFRDKEDVKQLAEELIGVKNLLESMRAQAHEYINKLHAISGLIQMGQYDKVVELITQFYKSKQELISFIVARIRDKATAGLLLGKVSQAQEKGVVLRIAPRSRLVRLPDHFSSASMVTVLGNLITNAIEAVAGQTAERRCVEVRISQGSKFLRISVTDRGCGIPQEKRQRIFERGFSTKQGSRGIGLALVREEVEASGGKIIVYSRVNEGSRFVVTIPMFREIEARRESEKNGNIYKRCHFGRRPNGTGTAPAIFEQGQRL
ncbi:signal transduction histidine kinase regulating citrate/malate metabolism [Thermosinus carboxydivorans Nor1]|uniref:histidine kinase n=1 Tax=Thermosinus carboxydivorans Nor1 TaxID=401526 RepID=A1HPJ9_9FIRM|nr:ATP-binding protein [Thermosinus carboxydivorans]EAX47972.1 signal transduction histidine kinase regulating citrate/malate metabolism [Thermosinus carboxydivorans Nor1]